MLPRNHNTSGMRVSILYCELNADNKEGSASCFDVVNHVAGAFTFHVKV